MSNGVDNIIDIVLKPVNFEGINRNFRFGMRLHLFGSIYLLAAGTNQFDRMTTFLMVHNLVSLVAVKKNILRIVM